MLAKYGTFTVIALTQKNAKNRSTVVSVQTKAGRNGKTVYILTIKIGTEITIAQYILIY